jgi:type IV secretory pathway VirB10-like protein
MTSRSAVIALVAMLCVAAAGGGAYLAVRDNRATSAAELSALPPVEAATKPAPPPAAQGSATDTVVPVTDEGAGGSKPVEKDSQAAATNGDQAARPPVPRARRNAPAREPSRASTAAAQTVEPPLTSPAPAPVQQPVVHAPEPVSEPVAPVEREREPEREAPPSRTVEELVVAADSVIGLQMETTLTTERARVEDRVEARVTRDVTVGDRPAIPAGTRMIGSVSFVEKGGKVRERARLGVRFHTLVLADGTTLPVQTDTIFRDGDSPAGSSTAKIGGAAVGGAILGAIFGGGKGAIIGGTTGAAGGTAAVMAGDRKPAVLPAGTSVTVRLSAPVTVTVEREQEPHL